MELPEAKYFRKLDKTIRYCQSHEYNWSFRLDDGLFSRWGYLKEDNPSYSPFGPEILDIEVSTICSGINGKPCKFCYKSNGPVGKSMSLNEFKRILATMPPNLTQIAFGIGDFHAVDIINMMWHTRKQGIIPNITVNGWDLSDTDIDNLAQVCGAVAVSNYDRILCYDTVRRLHEASLRPGATLKQVNIHQLLAQETYRECIQVAVDHQDGRIPGLNAIVFLMLKPKGRGISLHPISKDGYGILMDSMFIQGTIFGMDSCSAPSFLKAAESYSPGLLPKILEQAEPCESGLFSSYINVDGKFFPCSFAEDTPGWEDGIPVEHDFLKEVWYHPRTIQWRERLLGTTAQCNCRFKDSCRKCPIYNISLCMDEDTH